MHWNALILLRSAAHVDAVLRLALGDDTGGPTWNHPRRAVHGRHDLAADFAELRIGQPSDSVDQGVELLDHTRNRGNVGRHLERPVFPVLAALMQILTVRTVAGDDVESLAHDEVFEGCAVHGGGGLAT